MVEGKEVWLPAQVTEVHEEGPIQRIKVHFLEGKHPDIEALWPSDKRNVAPCGTYISERLCPDSARKQVKISFQPAASPVLEN